MKSLIVFLFLVFTSVSVSLAQDIITLKSEGELKVRIIKLTTKDVVYIPENSFDTVNLPRGDISKLQYQSGIIIFLSETELPGSRAALEKDSLYVLGETDAGRYYKGYKGAAVGTMIASLWIPMGLIPAIACSATPPDINNLGYMNQKLIDNSSYFNGYTTMAYKIKKKKVWGGFAIGSGVTIVIAVLASVFAATTY